MTTGYINLPLAGGGAGTGSGSPSDSPATSATGTASLVALQKRDMSRVSATKLYFATTFSTSGDNTIIAAPAAGVRIVIAALRIQNATDIATSILVKDGAATTLQWKMESYLGRKSGFWRGLSQGNPYRYTDVTLVY